MPNSNARARRAPHRPTAGRAAVGETDAVYGLDASLVIVGATVALTAVVFWRAAHDSFGVVKLSVLAVGGLTVAAVAGWRSIERGVIRVPRSPAALFVALLVAGALVATVLSPAPASSLVGEYGRNAGLLAYTAAAVLFLVVLGATPARLRAITWSIVAATTVIVAYGLVQVAGQDPLEWVDIGLDPTIATLGQPNFLAGYLGTALPIVVWAALFAAVPGWLRLASGVAGVAAVVVILETGSFQGPVAGVVGLVVLLGAWAAVRLPSSWRRAGLAVLLAGVVVVVALPTSRDAIDRQVQEGMDERELLWEAAGDMIGDRPLAGGGLGSYARHFTRERPAEHARFGFLPADAPHSVPLALAVGGGALVFLPYAAFVLYTGLSLGLGLRRTEGKRRLLLAAFGGSWLGYQVQSLVSIDIPPLIALHFVTAGAVIALSRTPPAHEIAIGSLQPRTVGTGRRRKLVASQYAMPVKVGLVMVAVVAAWLLLRPLRADLAAGASTTARASGDVGLAIERLDSATSLAPWEGLYHGMRAAALVEAGRAADALVAGMKAAERRPGNIQYALSTAGLAANLEQPDVADHWYRWAVEHDPSNASVVEAAAGHFLATERPAEAQRLAGAFTQRQPGVADGWALLAEAQLAAGDSDAAAASIDQALMLNPAHGKALELREEHQAPTDGGEDSPEGS